MVEKRKKTRSTSSSVDPTTRYAMDVASGKEIAGPDIRNSCKRHLKDLESCHARGLVWDTVTAQRAIDFFAKVLKLNGGEHEGKPFNLLPWQCFIVGSVFGWQNSDGYRRFRMVYVESGTITLGESGWFKIATVVMPQSASTVVIKLYGGAGFNVGAFETAAISELVLRSGNGSPAGITATLWERSPNGVLECAWINTSGDTYDIYINIGQYAYWLIAQYDYTGNANVTLHSTPEYSSVQPGNSTSGQTYTLFNSLMKPTAGDVEALSVNGGRLNGSLGIGTDNALGGNSIVLGDNDTGFKQDGDGVLGIYANNARVGYIDNSGLHMSVDVLTNGGIRAGDGKRLSLTSNNNSTMTATFNLWGDANRPTVIELDDDQGWHLYSQRNPDGSIVFTVNGDITANTLRAGGAIYQNNGDIFGSVWGNSWLSLWINNNFVADVQLGAGTSVTTWNNAGSWPNTPGYVVTSVWKDAQGENIDGINYAPLQKRVGNQWYTVQGGTA